MFKDQNVILAYLSQGELFWSAAVRRPSVCLKYFDNFDHFWRTTSPNLTKRSTKHTYRKVVLNGKIIGPFSMEKKIKK